MNKVMTLFEGKLMPLASRFASNRYFCALRDGMVLSMSLLIVGSLILVVAELPIEGYQNFMLQSFGENWKWFSSAATSATTGCVAIFAIIGIANALANQYNKHAVSAIALSLSSYLVLLIQVEEGGFSLRDFGAKGLFAAIFTAFIATELFCKIQDKKLTIKMPDGVPPAIADSFAALVPAAIIIPIFLIIRFLFTLTPYESVTSFILNVLQTPLTGITSSYGGIMVSVFSSHFLWLLGIHGGSIVSAVTGPMFQAASMENLEAFKLGLELPHIVTQQFSDFFQGYGGVGSTLALTFLMMFFCKSKQLKMLGRLTVVPGIFGINEPIVYGLPLVMNPIIAIPFFLSPLFCVTSAYFAMEWGWVAPVTGIQIPWTAPPLLSGFLSTNDARAAILQAVGILVSGLLYYPFIRIWDKRLLAEEQRDLVELDGKE